MNAKKSNSISNLFHKEYKNFLKFTNRHWSENSEGSSEDILQDVFTNILNKSDISVPLENLASYIYRSIKNRIIDLVRKKSNQNVSLDYQNSENEPSLLSIMEDERFIPEDEYEAEELKEIIIEAMDHLSIEERKVVYETEFNGVPFKLLAELWEVPIGTLLSRKKRALDKLKLLLEDYFEEEI